MSSSKKRVDKYYFDLKQPTAFTSAQNVAQKSGVPVEEVQDYLAEHPSHTLYKRYRKHYPRRRTIGIAPGQTIQADLADFQSLRTDNDGHGYLLLAVDCYSRYFFAIPVRRKSAGDMLAAIKLLFEKLDERYGHLCTRFVTDQGKEFYNKECSALFKQNRIEHFSPRSEIKAAMAERGIQTFKRRLYKYMHHVDSDRWIEAVEPIITAMNRTRNRMTGLAPENVKTGDIDEFPDRKNVNRVPDANYAVGDSVRISKSRAVFDKSYLP